MNRVHIASIVIAALIAAPAAVAPADGKARGHDHTQTIAIIGDIPYGAALIAEFPADIAQINADPDVSRVIHLGDIKNGSSRCDDSYFQARLDDFQVFADPLVYTPGDNEWTDCHRSNNGGYLPTERLAKIRELFFPQPGETLGAKAKVRPQSRTYPENVTWRSDGAQFGVVHVVGSNDDQFPWYADRRDASGTLVPETPAEAALQAREFLPRGFTLGSPRAQRATASSRCSAAAMLHCIDALIQWAHVRSSDGHRADARRGRTGDPGPGSCCDQRAAAGGLGARAWPAAHSGQPAAGGSLPAPRSGPA
jgi:hypothetical protein